MRLARAGGVGHPLVMRRAYALLLLALPGVAGAQTRFRFPADDPTGDYFLRKPIVGVDHDPTPGAPSTQCTNYAGQPLPYCYNDHEGTDFLLRLGFSTMDNYDVRVVAAADGEVSAAHDGEYDRCHGAIGSVVSCDGHPNVANSVTLRHADGLVTKYWHLKKGSVAVAVGQKVACGALLGFVGSSGESSTPHLHFGVEDKAGATIDPYAGPKSQPLSYWTLQAGPFERPGDRCAGVPYPDARPEAGIVPRDSGPAVEGGGGGPAAAGCSLAPGPASPPGVLALALLALLLIRSRRVAGPLPRVPAAALVVSARRSGGARRRSRSSRR